VRYRGPHLHECTPSAAMQQLDKVRFNVRVLQSADFGHRSAIQCPLQMASVGNVVVNKHYAGIAA
jgi:hypothetical protein